MYLLLTSPCTTSPGITTQRASSHEAGHGCVAVDVQAIVLAGQHNTALVHQADVEALRVFHLALQRRDQLSVLREDRQVEVVVIVGDQDLSRLVDADADGVVGDALAADLPQEHALVVEDFDAVGAVVADEDLFLVVDHHSVGKLQMLAAAELV